MGDHFLEELDKYDYAHPLFRSETFNFFGYYCPVCYCTDRDRFYIMYLSNYLKTIDKTVKFNFLDIAPSLALRYWVKKKYSWVDYRTADLYMKNVDDQIDVTNMDIYPDGKFDFILCSHVLEHIENDRQALKELYRVLAIKGKAIIMVPISLSLTEDLEDPSYKTEAQRWKYYGQGDHVRMYSKNGFVTKLKETGFSLSLLDMDYFGKEQFAKNGIHRRSVLYVVQK